MALVDVSAGGSEGLGGAEGCERDGEGSGGRGNGKSFRCVESTDDAMAKPVCSERRADPTEHTVPTK